MSTYKKNSELFRKIYNHCNYFMQLLDQSENNTLFDFSEITYDQLKTLWWTETVTDHVIAKIFNVDKKVVIKKLNDFKISQFEMKRQSDNKRMEEVLDYLTYIIKRDIEKEANGLSATEIVDKHIKEFKETIISFNS